MGIYTVLTGLEVAGCLESGVGWMKRVSPGAAQAQPTAEREDREGQPKSECKEGVRV